MTHVVSDISAGGQQSDAVENRLSLANRHTAHDDHACTANSVIVLNNEGTDENSKEEKETGLDGRKGRRIEMKLGNDEKGRIEWNRMGKECREEIWI